MLNWLIRWRQPYAWVVTIYGPDNLQEIWGIFTKGEYARQAMLKWKIREIFPPPDFTIKVMPYIADYRVLSAPPDYWRADGTTAAGLDYTKPDFGAER